MRVRAFDASRKSGVGEQRGDVPGCVNIAISVVILAQSIVAGEVLDVNSLSTFHSSLYISRNGNGYLGMRFFFDWQTIATGGRKRTVSTGNIMVSVISNILQLIFAIRTWSLFDMEKDC